ncbi:capn5 [Bugula neritina]|uniref:Capn5 n=1 Tax=Bugula neritina TaxID=10212 RepID=A0A7J7KI68_BUGNE|nr:capn5 [Bugula neritina]
MVFSQLEEALANSALIVAEVKNVNASELASEEEAISGGAIDVPEGTDVLVLNSSPPATQSGGSDATRAPKTGYFRDNSIVRDSFMTDGGLLMDHGYNLREVKNIQIRRGESYRMVRLQTPWQTGQWMGRWSNVSQEMKSMTVQERNKLGLKFENESDFWMLLSDFLANFTHMDVCHFFKTSMFTLKRSWTESALTGEWINSLHDNRSGGSLSHATFFNNPQYMFDMTVSSNSVNYPLMVSLEQNDRTLVRRGERGSKNSSIGFTIMKVEENREYRLHRVADVITSSDYSTDRSVFLKTPLNAGRYVIVPTIEKPGPVGQFFLRVYNSCGTVAKELMRDEPNSTKPCCGSAVFLAVQLTVTRAEDLINEKRDVLNPFCVVKCEGDSVKTKVIKDSSSPQWNDKFIFYKKANGERKPITLQVSCCWPI